MCGLVGVFGPSLGLSFLTAFDHLLEVDRTRGKDSTGISLFYETERGGRFPTLKSVGMPHALRDTQAYKKFFTEDFVPKNHELIRVAMGHNRAATLGEVNKANAHPYSFSEIIGAHNGTLTGGYKSFEGYEPELSDSYNMFKEINRLLVPISKDDLDARDAVIIKVLDGVLGAFAVSIIDKKTGRFYLCRNDKRPLHYSYMERGNFIYASEPWMVLSASVAGRVFKMATYDHKTHILEIPINKLHRFNPNGANSKEVLEKITPFPTPVYSGYYAGSSANSQTTKEFKEVENARFKHSGYGRLTIKNLLCVLHPDYYGPNKTREVTPKESLKLMDFMGETITIGLVFGFYHKPMVEKIKDIIDKVEKGEILVSDTALFLSEVHHYKGAKEFNATISDMKVCDDWLFEGEDSEHSWEPWYYALDKHQDIFELHLPEFNFEASMVSTSGKKKPVSKVINLHPPKKDVVNKATTATNTNQSQGAVLRIAQPSKLKCDGCLEPIYKTERYRVSDNGKFHLCKDCLENPFMDSFTGVILNDGEK